MTNATENPFENLIRHDLHQYLTGLGAVDSRRPECPDVEALWPALCQAYLPDGIREFDQYPVVSLGWPMFLGMAVAKYWDEDWEKHSRNPDLYTTLRDRRGFDHMDDYILESVLRQSKDTCAATAGIVAECAARTLSTLRRQRIEPGTAQAFEAYAACLRQLFVMGMAMQLKAMGYHMTPIA